MKKKRNLLSQMTTEQIVQRAIKKFAQNNNAVEMFSVRNTAARMVNDVTFRAFSYVFSN